MFSLFRSYFTSIKFIYSYNFNEHICNNCHIVLGITNNDKVGIAFEKFYEDQYRNNVISKIHLYNYCIRDKCNNNEIIYYFGENNNQIRLKFYVKNNVEGNIKDFYYHLFSVEENIDIHIQLKEEYIDFFINSRFHEMNKHFKNSDFIYFINLISQERKLLYNKIPFIQEKEEENVIKNEPKKDEINLLSFN